MDRKNVFEYLSQIVTLVQFLIFSSTLYVFFKGYIGMTIEVLILSVLVVVSMLYCIYLTYWTPRLYVAHSERESVKSIEQIYKRVNSFLNRNKLVHLYEANLETRSPGGILDYDKKMAVRNSGVTVRWKMVILKTPAKEDWIKDWKKDVWNKNDDCELYVVKSESPLSDYQLLNFMTIPDIGETYIGYGHYPGFQGGGIRIRDKRISMELKGVIDNWSKIGIEEQRLS